MKLCNAGEAYGIAAVVTLVYAYAACKQALSAGMLSLHNSLNGSQDPS